jgi:hypothetical protein
VIPVIAHFGHWYVGLAFASPVLVLGGALGYSTFRHRRDRR